MGDYSYKVTKHDPATKGTAEWDRWTAISDVGETVSLSEYLYVESKYIQAVYFFSNKLGVDSYQISALSTWLKNKYRKLHNGDTINLYELGDIVKALLREEFWCKLISKHGEIHFGYDYYMYFVAYNNPLESIDELSKILFTEEFTSPYLEQEGE